ncbi:DOMON domain [Sesbania bispinosa]|nr:DOMON domain [Sesbania bispinosa]
MVPDMLRVGLAVLSSMVVLTSSAQTCKEYSFPDKKVFATCRDLPQLSSFLHWTYEQATGKLDIAYRHSGITSTDTWVAWAINPSNNLNQAMVGAQALVAFPQSPPKVYTSSITSYNTLLEEGNITYACSNLKATFQNSEVKIFATLTLPKGTTSLLHVWQDGSLSGSIPEVHEQDPPHLNSKEKLDLLSHT